MAKDPETSQRELDEMVETDIQFEVHELPLIQAVLTLADELDQD